MSEICKYITSGPMAPLPGLRSSVDERTPQRVVLESDYDALAARVVELEQALDPRRWDPTLNEAWHSHLPDTMAAFRALRDTAVNVKREPWLADADSGDSAPTHPDKPNT